MRGIVFKADSNVFEVQWRFVLAQVINNMNSHGMTLKDALLAYVYPHNIPTKPTVLTEGFEIVDKDMGIVWFSDGYLGVEKHLFWRVEASDGIYCFNNCNALCPDGTLIYFP